MRNSPGQQLRDRIATRQRNRWLREQDLREQREATQSRIGKARRRRALKAEKKSVYTVLNQGEMWWDWQGEPHTIKSMTIRHKKNLLGWLERHSKDLQDEYLWQMSGVFSGAPDEVWAEMEVDQLRLGRMDSVAFILQTKLYKAIHRSIARGEESESDRPWEEGGRDRYVKEIVKPFPPDHDFREDDCDLVG